MHTHLARLGTYTQVEKLKKEKEEIQLVDHEELERQKKETEVCINMCVDKGRRGATCV